MRGDQMKEGVGGGVYIPTPEMIKQSQLDRVQSWKSRTLHLPPPPQHLEESNKYDILSPFSNLYNTTISIS